ncbi:MAG: YjbH domain-containing protein [Sphingomonadales bacterium]
MRKRVGTRRQGVAGRLIVALPLVAASVQLSGPAAARELDFYSTPDIYSANDFGGVGLLNMRTARFAPDGKLEVGASFVNPYRRYYITWQIFPWMEATFRYTDPTNDLTSGGILDQNQKEFFRDIIKFKQGGTNLDRGADLKFKLWDEGPVRPAVAVGLQDGLGTGLFSGEYLVASKRFYDLDFTVGVGWGYFASRGTFKNPLRAFSSRFKTRGGSKRGGGRTLLGNFFSGEQIGLFGGVEYHTPVNGLSVKAEYNSADPANEPRGNAQSETLPIGIGINYRPSKWGEIALGLERGNSIMLRGSIRYNLHEPGLPKFDPPPPVLVPRSKQQKKVAATADVGGPRVDKSLHASLSRRVEERGFVLLAYEPTGRAPTLTVQSDDGAHPTTGTQSLARAIFAELPEADRQIRLVVRHAGAARTLVLQRSVVQSWARVDVALDAFDAAATQVTSIRSRGDLATIDVAKPDEMIADSGGSEPGRLARHLLGLLPEGTGFVEVATDDGQSSRMAYGDLASELMHQRLASELDAQGFPIDRVTVTDGSGKIDVHAPYWGESKDYREIAQIALKASSDLVDTITIVGARSEVEVGRITVRSDVGDQLDKEADPPTSSGLAAGSSDEANREHEDAAERIFAGLGKAGYAASAIHITDIRATLYVPSVRYRQAARNIGRVTRVAANYLPPSVEEITIVTIIAGIPVSKVTTFRGDFERAVMHRGSPEEILAHAKIEKPPARVRLPEGAIKGKSPYPIFRWSLRPELKQHLGDPDTGLYLADINLLLTARLDLAPGLSVRAAYSRFLFGNLDRIRRDSDSVLPRVRSDLRQFLQEGRSSMPKLQADYIFSPAKDVFARASAGIFEWMYGGVGGEVLYRPYGANWAIGADLNWVKQRDFNQGFRFRDYQTVTGHVTVNYELPVSDILVTVDAGRYLARDWGATLTVSREFKSGVRVGAWATKTNVSAAEFGEGSFDKGFFIVFPLEMFMLQSNRNHASFAFRPLARDGGQRLNIGPRLYDLSREGNSPNILRDWGRVLD